MLLLICNRFIASRADKALFGPVRPRAFIGVGHPIFAVDQAFFGGLSNDQVGHSNLPTF